MPLEYDYAFFYDPLPEFVWICNNAGQVIFFNKAWYAYTGSTRENSHGDAWLEYVHPDDQKHISEEWQSAVTNSTRYDTKARFRRHDGEYRWHITRATPQYKENRQKKWIGLCTDIHDNVELMAKYENQTELFKTTLEQIPFAVIIAEAPTGKLVFANNQMENVWKFPMKPSQCVDEYKDWIAFHPDGTRYEGKDWALARSLQTGEIVINEVTDVLLGDGSRAPISLTSAPVRNKEGNIVAAVVICENINEKLKLQEEHLKAINQAKSAIETSKFKSQFVANISHDLRTPINGIIGASSILSETQMTSDQREYLDIVIECSRSLLALINDVLDFSKLEEQKVELEDVDFSLEKLVESVLVVVRASISKEHTVTINYSITAPPKVRGDAKRIEQIFMNLINNAVKFTPDGGHIDVIVNANENLENAEIVTLDVHIKDTGIGVTTEQQKRLFKPFMQADSSTTRKYGGTGLGLSICLNLVRLMGGDITVRSREGEGSVFSFWVPLKQPVGGSPIDFSEDDFLETYERAQKRILLAEDNRSNAIIAKKLLGMHSYEHIDWVENGLEAVEKTREAHYDLILMDCQMPVMGGIEATTLIRGAGNQVPIIALTASATQDVRAMCIECGVDDISIKPFKVKNLLRKIDRLIVGKGKLNTITEGVSI